MGISETRSTAPKKSINLEQTIKNQKLLLETLTRELNGIKREKSVCAESVIDYSAQLQELKEDYGSLNDKYQILNLIINQMNAIFMLFRFNSKNKYEVTWANKQYSQLISKYMNNSGLKSGTQLSRLLSTADKEIITESFEFFTDNPTKAYSTIYNPIDSDGKKLWLLVNSVAAKLNSRGEPVEVVALIVDITDRIEAEEKIEQLKKENFHLKKRMKNMSLTKRETEIVSWIIRGYTNKEIAAELHISSYTVDTHRKKVMKRLKLKNTAELVNFATANNIN